MVPLLHKAAFSCTCERARPRASAWKTQERGSLGRNLSPSFPARLSSCPAAARETVVHTERPGSGRRRIGRAAVARLGDEPPDPGPGCDLPGAGALGLATGQERRTGGREVARIILDERPNGRPSSHLHRWALFDKGQTAAMPGVAMNMLRRRRGRAPPLPGRTAPGGGASTPGARADLPRGVREERSPSERIRRRKFLHRSSAEGRRPDRPSRLVGRPRGAPASETSDTARERRQTTRGDEDVCAEREAARRNSPPCGGPQDGRDARLAPSSRTAGPGWGSQAQRSPPPGAPGLACGKIRRRRPPHKGEVGAGAVPYFFLFCRFSTRSVTTAGSASVEVSPSAP